MSNPQPARTLRKPPIDIPLLRRTMWKVLQDCTGLDAQQVVMADPTEPNAKLPEYPFVTFKFTTVADYMSNDEMRQDAEGRWRLEGFRSAAVTVDCFGRDHDEAYSLAVCIQSAIWAQSASDLFYAANMAMWDCGSVVDLSGLLSTGFEGRARFDLKLGLTASLLTDTDSVESVDVGGVIISEAGERIPVTIKAS